MKNIKNYLLSFILGGIIFSGITVFAEFIVTADKIEYSANVSVKDKIDDLYTKVKPSYSGIVEITPTKSNQVLLTNNKIVNSNIIINKIPDKFIDISDSTIDVSNDLTIGKVAYKANGTRILGSHVEECVNGSHVWTQNDSTNGYNVVNYRPSLFSITATDVSGARFFWYYNSSINATQFYTVKPNNTESVVILRSFSEQTSFNLGSNYLQLKWGISSWLGQTLYYTVCR